MSKGISITQQGVPIEKAADYQKVLDSRWRFMEVELEVDLTITIPTFPTASFNQVQKVVLADHNLGFVPVFHCDFRLEGAPEFESYSDQGQVYCDEKSIFFERRVYTPAGNFATSWPLRLKAKVYNLPAFQEYRSIADAVSGVGRAESGIGVRALDGSDSNVKIDSSSPKGFSIDTKKKVLSVHKVSTKSINDYLWDRVMTTSVDTGANTFTVTTDPNIPAENNTGISWLKTGEPVILNPQDFATYPNPLGGSTYYLIKDSDNVVRLAQTQALAEAGVALDITTTGSLPMRLQHGSNVDSARVPHEVGYPPSYLFCAYEERDTGNVTLPLAHFSTTPLVQADTNYLYFRGVQAAYIAKIVYIILKDPVEIAS